MSVLMSLMMLLFSLSCPAVWQTHQRTKTYTQGHRPPMKLVSGEYCDGSHKRFRPRCAGRNWVTGQWDVQHAKRSALTHGPALDVTVGKNGTILSDPPKRQGHCPQRRQQTGIKAAATSGRGFPMHHRRELYLRGQGRERSQWPAQSRPRNQVQGAYNKNETITKSRRPPRATSPL